MILTVAIGDSVALTMDDEVPERPNRETVNAYADVLRQQAVMAYLALPSIDEADAALEAATHEGDD